MDLMTRRRFLLASGVTGAAALAGGATWYSMREVMSTAGTTPPDTRRLVIITLYGGNDSLNTVIPFANPAYEGSRPELAYGADEVLRLNSEVGLNPAMEGLHRYFTQNKLAIVRGVGYPKPDRSHFRSMDIWQSGDPVHPARTGWIGRWLDGAGGDGLSAVSFEQMLPPLLAGVTSAGAVVGLNGVKLPKSYDMQVLTELGRPVEGEAFLQACVASSLGDLPRIDAHIKDAKQRAAGKIPVGGEAPVATGTGGNSALAAQLNLVAQCIEANVATRVYSVSLGGFDTHADERAPHQGLLGILDRNVTAFLDRLSKTESADKVTVMVYSEFGRRVRANASDGTDHGTAADLLLIGHGVKGQLYGEAASLTDLDDGDLKYTTDFRDVYATILEQVLESDPERVLPGWKGRLPSVW